MRILFVCHRLPFPPNRGGKIRPFNMIRHLAQKHSVIVGSLAHSEQELQAGLGLKAYCEDLIAEVLPSSARWLQAWKALFTDIPSSTAYFWSPKLYRRIQAVLRKTNFDIIFVHCAFMAQYVNGLQNGYRILDFGDLDSSKWRAYSRYRALPLSWGYRFEARKLRRYEQNMARRFNHCTLTTRGELDEFSTLDVATPSTLIPNGVDCVYFCQRPQHIHDPSVVVFLGRMDYFPNVDGISHFAKTIFPIVRQNVPNTELRIIGSSPIRKVRALTRIPGVSVTGQVPDVRPYLADAAVSVAPLRIAQGTQNKILEAMAMGIPVVATSEAAKGIQALPERHLLVADGPEAFAGQVIRVLRDAALRQHLSEAGRRQVETAHDWSRSMAILYDILEQSSRPAKGPRTHRLLTELG